MALTISLAGKVAIITGASSGIGRAIAQAMGEAGARLVLVGRDPERLGETAAPIRAAGGEVHELVADVTADGAAGDIVDAAIGAFGGVDVLVNCAGVFLLGKPEESLDLLDRQWETNVRAPYALAVRALPELRRRGGAIIFLSSIAGKIGFPTASAYCATKGAVELLTRSLAVEEGPNGVRVNAIAPGNVETSMNAHLMADPGYKRSMLDATPLGRNGRPADIAPLAVLLASEHSSFATGASVLVDGGWVAR
jgi:NAD(P)-dependent dehydrogenase (short-subunit alcohol dehydrogenase family)